MLRGGMTDKARIAQVMRALSGGTLHAAGDGAQRKAGGWSGVMWGHRQHAPPRREAVHPSP